MQTGRIKFEDREQVLNSQITTLGRTSDNDISFPEDSNVSRFHAEIELRYGDYWLIDLRSSNGTTVNGSRVSSEVLLREGDEIVLGGSSKLRFTFKEEPVAETAESETEANVSGGIGEGAIIDDAEEAEAAADEIPAEEGAKSSKLPMLFGIAGLTFGLAIVCVVGVVLFSPQCSISASACEAKAVISKPETGDIIARPTEIELETENDDCAVSAVFTIDGKEIASVSDKPFGAKIDPARFANLSDGFEHMLAVELLDEDGNKISQTGEVALVFETQEIEPPKEESTPEDGGEITQKPTPSENSGASNVSVIDTKQMSENLLKQFSGNSVYKFDPEFLKEVQKRTSEFVSDGYFARASAFKDVINEAFVKEQNLDPALGYILAMSRTQFKLQNDAAGEGLWRMPKEFVVSNGYAQLCGENPSLSEPQQICASKASSLYLKGLAIGVFEGDLVYTIAAFGKSPQAANIWKSTLPADRADFWNVIKTPKERDQIVRFFAAAVVIQNPQKFGLKNDRPISELYAFMMQK